MSEFDFGAEYAAFGDDIKGTAYTGDFQMLVQKMKPGTTGKGKQMFTVTLAFQGGPLGAKGKTVEDRLYWSPESEQASKIFAGNLKILGASQDWIMSERPTPQQICDRCTGNIVDVRLSEGEFNGQPQTRVNYRKLVSANGPQGPVGSAAQAVSLDDEEPTGNSAQAVPLDEEPAKQPATVGAGASGTGDGDDPWG